MYCEIYAKINIIETPKQEVDGVGDYVNVKDMRAYQKEADGET